MGYKIADVFFPVMIHFLVLQCTALIGGNALDATLRVTIAAAVTLPMFAGMYQRDRQIWKREEKSITWYAALFTAAGAVVLNITLSRVVLWFAELEGFSNAAQKELFAGEMVFQIIGTGLLVPVTEEILFRGLVYQRLERYLPAVPAVGLGAVLFALYHGNPTQILFAFPMGVLLNLLYRHYGNVKMPILFHAASNLGAIFLQQVL